MSYDLSWLEEEKAQKNDKKQPTKTKILDSNKRDIQSYTDNKILSELEFKMFDNAVELIYNSNYKRYKTSKSRGMLNVLNTLKEIKEITRKRLNIN